MGIANRKISDSLAFSEMAMITAMISMMGARTIIRIISMKVICVLFTSVVSLVTREAVVNLSMFANEKSCIL